jgi:hypothetical protein
MVVGQQVGGRHLVAAAPDVSLLTQQGKARHGHGHRLHESSQIYSTEKGSGGCIRKKDRKGKIRNEKCMKNIRKKGENEVDRMRKKSKYRYM